MKHVMIQLELAHALRKLELYNINVIYADEIKYKLKYHFATENLLLFDCTKIICQGEYFLVKS